MTGYYKPVLVPIAKKDSIFRENWFMPNMPTTISSASLHSTASQVSSLDTAKLLSCRELNLWQRVKSKIHYYCHVKVLKQTLNQAS